MSAPRVTTDLYLVTEDLETFSKPIDGIRLTWGRGRRDERYRGPHFEGGRLFQRYDSSGCSELHTVQIVLPSDRVGKACSCGIFGVVFTRALGQGEGSFDTRNSAPLTIVYSDVQKSVPVKLARLLP
jgi:hypothetical protein